MLNRISVQGVKKILIIRFSSIGDIVLTSPIIRCLKEQVPNCELHYISKESYRSILEPNPHLDKIYTIEKNILEVIDLLKNENYDFVVDLHNNLRSNQLVRKLRTASGRLDKINIRKWMMVNLKINLLPSKHIVDRCFETVKELGVFNDMNGLEFHIDKKDEMDEVIKSQIRNPYAAIVLSGTYPTKQIPSEKIIELIQGLELRAILLGGPNEEKLADDIIKNCDKPIINYAGRLSVGQSADLIRKSELVITPDTGMMHIAAAFDKKIISIWGNTIAEFGMYPYLISNKRNLKIGEQDIIQVMNLACRPCTKLGKSACPKVHFKCMKDINVNQVLKIANKHKKQLKI